MISSLAPSGFRATVRRRAPARLPLAACATAALLLLALLLAAPARAQVNNGVEGTIRGQVIDDNTGRPIADVVVEILDHVERIRARAVTDADGNFLFTRVLPGAFWLRASHVAYARTKTPPWRVEAGEVLAVSLRLDTDVVLLAPLEVTARARTYSPSLAGFYDRLQRRNGGTLLSREEIERRNAGQVSELLQDLPGVNVQAAGGAYGQKVVTIGRALPGVAGSGCPVQIYVDGVRATRGRQEVSPDAIVTPALLEGVEVYRGLASIPAEFLSPEARCGVIAFWTRRS